MALYLLGKSDVNVSDITVINGQNIFSYYALISQIFSKYCNNILIAEPVTTKHDQENIFSVSWYADTSVEPESLDNSQKQDICNSLSSSISILRKNLSVDSLERQLIEAVFHIQSEQDILMVNGIIVLKGWGINENSTHVLYLPAFLNMEEKKEAVLSENQQRKPSSINIENNASTSLKKKSILFDTKNGFLSYITLSRILAAIIFFIIGLLLGFRLIYAERPFEVVGLSLDKAKTLVDRTPAIEQENRELNKEIEALKDKINHPPCDSKQDQAVSDSNKISENNKMPDQSDQSVTPITENNAKSQGNLPELLEKSTVFIMVVREQDDTATVGSGTGFFVTPDLIVTNRHVVENAKDNRVIVTNKNLGNLTMTHIVSLSHSSEVGGLDLAVLKVDAAPPQQFLRFTLNTQPLQDVVAAGYPGMIMAQDNSMQRLLKGDFHAIPSVIMTKGQVNGIQVTQQGEKIIPHSAMVSPGNSGGPLVDLCGRVVGVNTFVTMDQDTSSHGNYAQKSDSIIKALQEANIPIQVQSDTCQGQGQSNTDPSVAGQEKK